jgi:tRNA G18 (ribose-2'-O)-methylase SpoU
MKSTVSAAELLPITLICDDITDAGMLGTLIRSAVAASCSRIIVTKGCIDAWEPKVLRAGTGAHFYASSLVTNVGWERVAGFLLPNTCTFLVTDSQDSQLLSHSPLDSLQLTDLNCAVCGTRDIAIIVSNRLSDSVCKLSKQVISIATVDNGIGSPNVAVSGSVVLFEIVRQLRNSHAQLVNKSLADM